MSASHNGSSLTVNTRQNSMFKQQSTQKENSPVKINISKKKMMQSMKEPSRGQAALIKRSLQHVKEKKILTSEQQVERGLYLLHNVKFTQKVEGHTIFNQNRDMDLYRPPWQLMRDAIGHNGPNFEQELFRKIIIQKVKENNRRLEEKNKKKEGNSPRKGVSIKGFDPVELARKPLTKDKKLSLALTAHEKSENPFESASSFDSNSSNEDQALKNILLEEYEEIPLVTDTEITPSKAKTPADALKIQQEQTLNTFDDSMRQDKNIDYRLLSVLQKQKQWIKLQNMTQECNSISQSSKKFDEFLRKTHKKIKIKSIEQINKEIHNTMQQNKTHTMFDMKERRDSTGANHSPQVNSLMSFGTKSNGGDSPSLRLSSKAGLRTIIKDTKDGEELKTISDVHFGSVISKKTFRYIHPWDDEILKSQKRIGEIDLKLGEYGDYFNQSINHSSITRNVSRRSTINNQDQVCGKAFRLMPLVHKNLVRGDLNKVSRINKTLINRSKMESDLMNKTEQKWPEHYQFRIRKTSQGSPRRLVMSKQYRGRNHSVMGGELDQETLSTHNGRTTPATPNVRQTMSVMECPTADRVVIKHGNKRNKMNRRFYNTIYGKA